MLALAALAALSVPAIRRELADQNRELSTAMGERFVAWVHDEFQLSDNQRAGVRATVTDSLTRSYAVLAAGYPLFSDEQDLDGLQGLPWDSGRAEVSELRNALDDKVRLMPPDQYTKYDLPHGNETLRNVRTSLMGEPSGVAVVAQIVHDEAK